MASVDSIFCPACKQHTALSRVGHYDRHPFRFDIAECNNCVQHFLAVRDIGTKEILKIYPNSLPGVVDSQIPPAIKKDFEEALICEAAGSYRGAATLARRTLQVICIDKGAPQEKQQKKNPEKMMKVDLSEQIDWLFSNHIITDEIKSWAHEVRYVGNDAAHPNATEVTKNDARDILELLESMCDVLYVAPARAAERKAKRTQTQEAGNEE